MEKITTYNYEAFYLDYLEGNLGDIEQAMLFDFLNVHPDLKADLELDDDVLTFSLNPDLQSLSKFEKEDLKYFDCKANEICLNNVADFMVAELEGEISADKKIKLSNFITDHALELDKNYFKATKLQVDLTEVYPNKNELKKTALILPLWLKISSVAAVGLLLFNFLGQSPNTAVYTPRQNNFALNIDANVTPFEIKMSNNRSTQKEFIASSSNQNEQKVIAKENPNHTDDTTIFIMDSTPDVDIVKEEKFNFNQKDKTPKVEGENDDVAFEDPHQNPLKSNNNIKLMDMYKPVTRLTNSYTNLNVSYKKSVPESEYQVTAFSIGKFSFERKRKK